MDNITVFDFQSNSVRTVSIAGKPWFVAQDICKVLQVKNVAQALSRLKTEHKGGIILNDTIGIEQNYAVISESGMYSLLLSSRKLVAKPFQEWVTETVLWSTGAIATITKNLVYYSLDYNRNSVLRS